MRTVKLTRDQFTRWRTNALAFVKAGTHEVVRYATVEEAVAFSKQTTRGIKTTLKINGLDVVGVHDRDLMKAEYLKGGDCILQSFNGRYVSTFRAPENAAPIVVPGAGTPDPDRCSCVRWKGRPDGKHHPSCRFNAKAPAEHQAPLPDPVVHLDAPVPSPATTEPPAPATIPSAPPAPEAEPEEEPDAPGAPEDCECQTWDWPEGADRYQHHELCEHRPSVALADLVAMNGQVVREATEAERAQAFAGLSKNSAGLPMLTIDGAEYLVVDRKAS